MNSTRAKIKADRTFAQALEIERRQLQFVKGEKPCLPRLIGLETKRWK